MTWGWVGVSFFTLMISSAYPTSGGLYWWAARLSTRRYAPAASWFSGWFNLIGQFAVTAGIDYGLALMLGAVVSIGQHGQWTPTPGATVGFHIAICVSHGIANSLGPGVMRRINSCSTWWQVISPLVIIITILAKAPTRQPGSFVFGHFNNDSGWDSKGYVVLVGLLQAQFTLTGYDSSAHMSEETKNAEISGPVGMVMAILVSAVMGWIFIIGFLFCIQDLESTINTSTNFPVMQIIVDSVGEKGGIVLMVMLMLACWFCGFASVTANSRMIYAFSRDGAMPGSNIWHKVDKKQTPLNAVWLSVLVASLLGLPSLGNSTAFSAITSVATIGLYLSYGIPIFAKLLNRKQFKPGPLHLGGFSDIINFVSLIWILFITILFVLPPEHPVTAINMNYASLALGAVILGAGGRFAIDARIWFKGPVINLSDEEREGRELEMNLADEEQSGDRSSSKKEENKRRPLTASNEVEVIETQEKQ
ncbi:amino acid/polyamine transporter I [Syncephalastrum racemosum]|uniref:Amino acid/polyamine transporter I n=1 Tax=Syncephalastrum racemosum TaxID=13706 RepID=A0A1X2HUY1_SYNRA|nr:amino acid/polyamine transporter I [Syncephalastrum racemosum]